MVFAHANIFTGVVNCAALTLDDVASLSILTAKNLNSESFGL